MLHEAFAKCGPEETKTLHTGPRRQSGPGWSAAPSAERRALPPRCCRIRLPGAAHVHAPSPREAQCPSRKQGVTLRAVGLAAWLKGDCETAAQAQAPGIQRSQRALPERQAQRRVLNPWRPGGAAHRRAQGPLRAEGGQGGGGRATASLPPHARPPPSPPLASAPRGTHMTGGRGGAGARL